MMASMNIDPDISSGSPQKLYQIAPDKYLAFSDGCALLVCAGIGQYQQLHSDALREMLFRWQSALWQSFEYENKRQIESFAPLAKRHIDAIYAELFKRLSYKQRRAVVVTPSGKLDSRIVRINIDVMRVLEHYFKDLKKVNGHYITKCLWHDDSKPSLAVYPDSHCHCYVCQKHISDIYGLVMDIEQVGFPEAIEIVAELGGYYGQAT